jgi:hypothetical protein
MAGTSSQKDPQDIRIAISPGLISIYFCVLAAIVTWLAFHDTRPHHPFQTCISNLRQIDGAIQQWAIETKQPTNAAPNWDDIRPYFANHPIPACPDGGTYTLGQVAIHPRCSIANHNRAFDP